MIAIHTVSWWMLLQWKFTLMYVTITWSHYYLTKPRVFILSRSRGIAEPGCSGAHAAPPQHFHPRPCVTHNFIWFSLHDARRCVAHHKHFIREQISTIFVSLATLSGKQMVNNNVKDCTKGAGHKKRHTVREEQIKALLFIVCVAKGDTTTWEANGRHEAKEGRVSEHVKKEW